MSKFPSAVTLKPTPGLPLNKKLANMAEGTASSDAITKHQLDTAMIDKHDNNQNIHLKNTYNVINSKQQKFSEMNASRNTLVYYEDVKDVFVSRKESVFPMQTHLDMGNNYIYNVKTPVNNDQGANKFHVDQKVDKSGDAMTGDLDMRNTHRIINLAGPVNGGDFVTIYLFIYLIAFTMITMLKKTRGKIHLNKTQKRGTKVRDTYTRSRKE